jgi:hypothetical protein
MSAQKMVVPGFGTGSFYGTPVTRPLDSTSTVTLTGTVLPAGQYMVTGLVTGTTVKLASTTNGVTGTYTILSGAPGVINYDGASGTLVSTTTSVSVVFIQT